VLHHSLEERIEHLGKGLSRSPAQPVEAAGFGELRARGILGLGQAVRIAEEGRADLELALQAGVAPAARGAHQHSARHRQPAHPGAGAHHRRAVAAVRVHEPAALHVEEAAQKRHEEVRVVADAEPVVQRLEEPVGLHRVRGQRAKQADHAHHEEGRGDAVPRDIPDAHEQRAAVHEEDVEEVPADLRRRLHEAAHLDVGPAREQGALQRQHARLQLPRDLELLLEVLQLQVLALHRQRFLVGVAHPLGESGHQVGRHAAQRHDAVPENVAVEPQHARIRHGAHQGRDRLAVDGRKLADALAGSDAEDGSGVRLLPQLGDQLPGEQDVDVPVGLAGTQQRRARGQHQDLAIGEGIVEVLRIGVAKQRDPPERLPSALPVPVLLRARTILDAPVGSAAEVGGRRHGRFPAHSERELVQAVFPRVAQPVRAAPDHPQPAAARDRLAERARQRLLGDGRGIEPVAGVAHRHARVTAVLDAARLQQHPDRRGARGRTAVRHDIGQRLVQAQQEPLGARLGDFALLARRGQPLGGAAHLRGACIDRELVRSRRHGAALRPRPLFRPPGSSGTRGSARRRRSPRGSSRPTSLHPRPAPSCRRAVGPPWRW
jgi:hypothetical protein